MFDPYHKWLGILPKDQPPHHYRLLSLEPFESDLDVIEGAADRQMGFIRQYQSGEHAASAAKLLNEIAIARLCLLKPASKVEYDVKLRLQLSASDKSTVPASKIDDGLPFQMDINLTAAVKAPNRKKTIAPQKMWIAGGIGAVTCILIVGFLLSSASRPPAPAPAIPVAQNERFDVKSEPLPTTTPTPMSTVTPSPPIVELTVPATPPGPAESPKKPDVEMATVPTPSTQPKAELTPANPSADSKNITLNESELVDEPDGQSVDLMESINAQVKDRYVWLNTQVPSDYQLKFSLMRLTGNTPLWIGFVMEGRQGVVVFDGLSPKVSGLYVDGREPNANCSTRSGAIFENGRPSLVVLTIHPGHVHAAVDEKTIIDWSGESDRFYYLASNKFPLNREMPFITIPPKVYQVISAEMIPIKPERKTPRVKTLDVPVDLMPLFDLSRDAKKGLWTLKQNGLASPDRFAQIQIPVEPPDEYSLSATIERPANAKGDPQLSVGLLAGTALCQIVTFDEEGFGLDMINGQRWNKNATHGIGNPLKPGESVKVVYTVTKRGIRFDLDGRTLIEWRGDHELLGLPPEIYLADAKKMFLASQSKYLFRDLKIGPPLDPPNLLVHLPMVAGHSIELLSLVDLKRDVLSGTWQSNGTSKRVLGSENVSKLLIPSEVPAEYKLSNFAGREASGMRKDDLLTLILPSPSSTAELSIDAASSTICGFHIDGLPATDPRNPTSRPFHAIPLGKAPEMNIFVRKTGLTVTLEGKSIIQWNGNLNRLTRSPEYLTPEGRIALCSVKNQFVFPKLLIEPLEPSSFPPVPELGADGNLLAIIDPQRDSRGGEWKLDEKGLYPARIPLPWISIPVPVPDKYSLTATVERIEGVEEFLVGLVVGGRPCTAGIDGAKGTIAGLMSLDNFTFEDVTNPTRRRYSKPLFPIGKRITLRCIVLPDTVIVNCGEKEVLRWHGDARRFSPPSSGYLPPNYSSDERDHLWIGAIDSAFAIHKLELKQLSDDESTEVANGFSGVFPISPQGQLPLGNAGAKAK